MLRQSSRCVCGGGLGVGGGKRGRGGDGGPAAVDPVHVEVLGKEGSADHADALLHPPGQPQLAHASVHQGEPRPPLLPRLEGCRVIPPLLQDIFQAWSEMYGPIHRLDTPLAPMDRWRGNMYDRFPSNSYA